MTVGTVVRPSALTLVSRTLPSATCRSLASTCGGGARNQVEELRNLAVKQGSFHRFHGWDEEVICCIVFDVLYKGSCKGSIDAVPDGDR